MSSFGLANRLRFQPGSFFSDPLPAADVLVMGHILHDWDLEEKRALIAKAYKALPKGGEVAIFVGQMDASNAIERRQGVLDVLAGKDRKEMGEVTPVK